MSGQIDLFQKESEFVLGRPVVSIFHNPQNLFSIIKVKIQQTNTPYTEKEIIVSGYFPKLSLEEQYKFTGSVKNHPKYGVQFQAETFKKEVPETEQGVVHYLSSDLFNGIGRKTAETIVKKLGSDAIKKILEDPDSLDGVPRLSDEKKDTIRSTLQMNLGLERVMIQLNDWGFGPQIGMRIYQAYREETIDILTKNPFQLIEEIEGIGFHRADELGSKLGITGSHPDRIKAAILHVLNQASLSEGHVFVDAKNLIPLVKQMLEASQREDITAGLLEQGVEGEHVEYGVCPANTPAFPTKFATSGGETLGAAGTSSEHYSGMAAEAPGAKFYHLRMVSACGGSSQGLTYRGGSGAGCSNCSSCCTRCGAATRCCRSSRPTLGKLNSTTKAANSGTAVKTTVKSPAGIPWRPMISSRVQKKLETWSSE